MDIALFLRASTLALLLAVSLPVSVRAAATDYSFELVDAELQSGAGVTLAVRLVDQRTGKSVPDAVIFASRLDMAPDGMETMATRIKSLPPSEPGVYLFDADLSEGNWRLSLAAKVQGESETVRSELALKVLP